MGVWAGAVNPRPKCGEGRCRKIEARTRSERIEREERSMI